MQSLLAGNPLAVEWGDQVFQGLFTGQSMESMAISTAAAVGIAYLLGRKIGWIVGIILGLIGNYVYVHRIKNGPDASWEALNSADGAIIFLSAIIVAGLSKMLNKGWGGLVIGFGLTMFAYIFIWHFFVPLWDSLEAGGFGF